MRKYHSVPLIFHDPAYAKYAENEDAHLGYRIEPAQTKQRVHEGRFLLTPDLDLNDYRCRAVIDWVEVGFRTKGLHQAGNTQSFLQKKLKKMGSGSSAFVSGVERSRGYQGDRFIARVQDPRPKELACLVEALQNRFEITRHEEQLFSIPGIEVSIDFFPLGKKELKDWELELARLRMSELLRKHVNIKSTFYRHRKDAPRAVFGPGHPARVIPFKKRACPDEVVQALRDGTLGGILRPLKVAAHRQPSIDATFKVGRRGAEVSLTLQDKIGDQRNGADGKWRELKDNEKRSRIEVTLLRDEWALNDGPASVGLHSVEDLYGFQFVDIRKAEFDFYLPTFAPDPESPVSPDPVELEVFRRSGTLGLHEYQRAKQSLERGAVVKGRNWANFDCSKRKEPRGYRRGYRDLNDRVRRALRGLSQEWRR